MGSINKTYETLSFEPAPSFKKCGLPTDVEGTLLTFHKRVLNLFLATHLRRARCLNKCNSQGQNFKVFIHDPILNARCTFLKFCKFHWSNSYKMVDVHLPCRCIIPPCMILATMHLSSSFNFRVIP